MTDGAKPGARVSRADANGATNSRVGIEVGGTFTDLIAVKDGALLLRKVPSTPAQPDLAVIDALRAADIDLRAVGDFVHGSTVATNALLERKGERTAFLTTRGFRDILEIQRHDRSNIFQIDYRKPAPIVDRSDCLEVTERIGADGTVVEPLDEADLRERIVPFLRSEGIGSVAICLLNGYENPIHEERVRDILNECLPGVLTTVSSAVIREFREYERASTTVLSTYVQPIINRYLGNLQSSLEALRFEGQIGIIQSNGGRIPIEGMRRTCISAFLSGPAAGVVGAIRQAERSGVGDIITFDMGGTSSDVCLIEKGEAAIAPQSEIDGLPIRYPMTDIVTIGAGGGSIISLDEGGMLRVGPRSAGAQPGPACYGRGGTLPTLTDAHLICGTLRAHTFLGGTMRLDIDASRKAFEPIATKLGLSVEALADGAISLAAANIVRAMQTVSTERGKDPRDFVLMPFGGAGPLGVTEIADELGIRKVLVPPNPGVLSAFGLLASDYKLIDVVPLFGVVSTALVEALRASVAEMVARAGAEFRELGVEGSPASKVLLDMRYRGQAFELQVPMALADIEALTGDDLTERFRAVYAAVFMDAAPGARPVELVSIRLMSANPVADVPRLSWSSSLESGETSIRVTRRGKSHDCREITVDRLGVERPVAGPALIVSDTSSVFVDRGWSVTRDPSDNLVLEVTR